MSCKVARLKKLEIHLLNTPQVTMKEVDIVKVEGLSRDRRQSQIYLISKGQILLRLAKLEDGCIHCFDPVDPIDVLEKDPENPPETPFKLPIFIQNLLN